MKCQRSAVGRRADRNRSTLDRADRHNVLGVEVLTKQRIVCHNVESQVMEGRFDTLLKLPNGEHALIEHKA